MRPLPHSEEVERAVLAAVLLQPTALEDLDLRADEFHVDRHRLLFRTYRDVAEKGEPLDIRTVQAQLEGRSQLADAGGLAYLTGLDLDLPDLSRLDAYARAVRDLARRRELIKLGHRLSQQAEKEKDVEALTGAYRRRLEDVEGGVLGGSVSRSSDLVGAVLEDAGARRAKRQETGEAVLGLRTGIPSLDHRLCGLNRGLYLLAGAPGVGKTSLALQVALHVARDRPVVYVTFENSAPNLVLKALCASAGLKMVDVSRGYVDPAPLAAAAETLGDALGRLQIVEGDGGFTVGRLRALSRQAMEKHGSGPSLVVVDYLQLWAKVSQELRSLTDARSKVDALSGELLGLARRLESPLLALSSQGRLAGGYGRGRGTSSLASFKESGDLEYSADVALFLTPDDDDQAEQEKPVRALELAVKKNRHGPTGSVPLVFQADQGRFRETDTRH